MKYSCVMSREGGKAEPLLFTTKSQAAAAANEGGKKG